MPVTDTLIEEHIKSHKPVRVEDLYDALKADKSSYAAEGDAVAATRAFFKANIQTHQELRGIPLNMSQQAFGGIGKTSAAAPESKAPPAARPSAEKLGGDRRDAGFLTTPLAEGARSYAQRAATAADTSLRSGPATTTARTADFGVGFAKGLADVGIDMTSPANLAMVLGSFAIPKNWEERGHKAKTLWKLAKWAGQGARGALSLEMLDDLARDLPEAYRAYKAGDPYAAGEMAAKSGAEILMMTGAGEREMDVRKGAKAEGLKAAEVKTSDTRTETPPVPRDEARTRRQIPLHARETAAEAPRSAPPPAARPRATGEPQSMRVPPELPRVTTPPESRVQQVVSETPGVQPRHTSEPQPMPVPLQAPRVAPPEPRVAAATEVPAFHGTERGAPSAAEQVSSPAGPQKRETAIKTKALDPPVSRTAAKTAAPPKPRREAKAEPKKVEARPLSAGTRYVVKDTNPDLGLYKGETVIYRGPYGGKYGFDVIDPDTGKKSLMQIESSTPMADIVSNLEEEGEKKKRPGDKHIGDSPQPVKAQPQEQPGILGQIKNKIGELLGPNVSREEATGEKVPQGEGDYSVAYSRTTHRPIIMAHSQEQMNELAGGDYGATFLKPGDVGVGGGPLAQVVRKSLAEGPVSVVGPDVTAPMEPAAPGKMQGTVQHEVIHQVMGDTKVSTDKFLDALPAEIAEPMRAHLTKNFPKSKWGEEIPAHLGASGVHAPGSDPRINQAETIGLSPEQAQKAWKVYLSLLAKQDPKKAAKLKAHMGADKNTTPPASRK